MDVPRETSLRSSGGTLKRSVLFELHDSPTGGHASIKRTIARVYAKFYFPDVVPYVTKCVEECPVCNRAKAQRQLSAPSDPLHVPPYPWHTVGPDYVTSLPMVKDLTQFWSWLII